MGPVVPKLVALAWRKLQYFDVTANRLSGSTFPHQEQESGQGNNDFGNGVAVRWTDLTHYQASYNLALRGTIPSNADLSSMTNLVWLDVSTTGLMGTIPVVLGTFCTNLIWLNMFSNDLTGTIPRSLSNLENLSYLDLGKNNLSGSVSLSITTHWKQMKWFSVRSNQFSNELPLQDPLLESSWQELTWYDISSNQFTGTIPSSLSTLSSTLTKFRIGNNNLQGTVPTDFTSLTKLTELSIHGNQIMGDLNVLYCDAINNDETTTTPTTNASTIIPRIMTADCEGSNPDIVCSCCSRCF